MQDIFGPISHEITIKWRYYSGSVIFSVNVRP